VIEELRYTELKKYLRGHNPNHQYTGTRIINNHYIIAMDQEERPNFIVLTEELINDSHSTDYLDLNMGKECSLLVDNERIFSRCHILSCNTNDEDLCNIFLKMIYTFCLQNEELNHRNIQDIFSNLIRLFQVSPSNELTKERQGLWSELFVIRHFIYKYDINLIPYWRSETTSKYDFSSDSIKFEVKSSTKPVRVHTFSHKQLFRPDNIQIVVASLLLLIDDSGLALRKIVDDLFPIFNKDIKYLTTLQKSLMRAGIFNISNYNETCFDESFAVTNLRFYSKDNIPRYAMPEPEGISNTRYDVDLTNVITYSESNVCDLIINA
jgi:hypothetical protein